MTGLLTGSYVPKAGFNHDYVTTVEGKPQAGAAYVFGVVPEDKDKKPLTPMSDRWTESLCSDSQ
jgi:hypothetical protein